MRLWDIYHSDIPLFLKQVAETKAMQRLLDVGMNCGCEYTQFSLFANIGTYSRFDHSMGVGLIVWHFTEDMEQAAAALLHDVATPAFAHVVDFLHGDHVKQESTESATEDVIRRSMEICGLLQEHNIPLDAVKDYHRYPVADNDSPRLSADRLEYTLGNAVNYKIITREQAAAFYEDLTVSQNEFCESELMFRSPETGYAFAAAALECGKIYVSAPNRYAMQSLADLLKTAIQRRILAEADLYARESDVIDRLAESEMLVRWEEFRSYREVVQADRPGNDGRWLRVVAKKRFIDPYVLGVGRVSEIFPDFREQLNAFRNLPLDNWICAK